jgi:hypothetical protein
MPCGPAGIVEGYDGDECGLSDTLLFAAFVRSYTSYVTALSRYVIAHHSAPIVLIVTAARVDDTVVPTTFAGVAHEPIHTF